MQNLILGFILMLLVFLGMSLGFIVQRKSIAGSCGGMGALGIDKACDCDDPCKASKKRAARAHREEAWQKDRIV